jgi:hypothetical protein
VVFWIVTQYNLLGDYHVLEEYTVSIFSVEASGTQKWNKNIERTGARMARRLANPRQGWGKCNQALSGTVGTDNWKVSLTEHLCLTEY